MCENIRVPPWASLDLQVQTSKKDLCKNAIFFLTYHFKHVILKGAQKNRGGCFEYPQHMFWLRNIKKISYTPLTGDLTLIVFGSQKTCLAELDCSFKKYILGGK